jgi:hypothetical protein
MILRQLRAAIAVIFGIIAIAAPYVPDQSVLKRY